MRAAIIIGLIAVIALSCVLVVHHYRHGRWVLAGFYLYVVLINLWMVALQLGPLKIGETYYHPIYGIYPAVVPCVQGMTLYPQQSCQGVMEFEFKLPRAGESV